MLLDRQVPIDLRDRNGLTPLHMAASAGNSDAVALFLAKGANHALYLQGWWGKYLYLDISISMYE